MPGSDDINVISVVGNSTLGSMGPAPPSTLQGFSSGVVPRLSVLPCVFVLEGFPSLLLHCKALGLTPHTVLCSPKWTKLVSDLISSGCLVYNHQPSGVWVPPFVTVALVEGQVTPRILSGF